MTLDFLTNVFSIIALPTDFVEVRIDAVERPKSVVAAEWGFVVAPCGALLIAMAIKSFRQNNYHIIIIFFARFFF